MNDGRNESSGHALLVYAALGVAIGLIAWAVFVHDSSGATAPGKKQQTLHTGAANDH